jgi:nucleotide-binding universal stress UspA family protein
MAVLALVRKLAERDGATVYVMHVAADSLIPRSVDFPRGWEKTTEVRLDKIAREGLGGTVPYESLVRIGEPATEIVEAGEDTDVDLIAMATHGRGGVSRLLIGSVTEAAMRRSPRPLLIVRPQPHAAVS